MEKKSEKKYFFEKNQSLIVFKKIFFFRIFFSMTKKYFFSKFYFPKRSGCVLSIPLLFIPIRPKHHYKKMVEKKFFSIIFSTRFSKSLWIEGPRCHKTPKK